MIQNIIQSIGIVFSLVLIAVLALVTLYFSYILSLGILFIGLVFIVYYLLGMFKQGLNKT